MKKRSYDVYFLGSEYTGHVEAYCWLHAMWKARRQYSGWPWVERA